MIFVCYYWNCWKSRITEWRRESAHAVDTADVVFLVYMFWHLPTNEWKTKIEKEGRIFTKAALLQCSPVSCMTKCCSKFGQCLVICVSELVTVESQSIFLFAIFHRIAHILTRTHTYSHMHAHRTTWRRESTRSPTSTLVLPRVTFSQMQWDIVEFAQKKLTVK